MLHNLDNLNKSKYRKIIHYYLNKIRLLFMFMFYLSIWQFFISLSLVTTLIIGNAHNFIFILNKFY